MEEIILLHEIKNIIKINFYGEHWVAKIQHGNYQLFDHYFYFVSWNNNGFFPFIWKDTRVQAGTKR